MSIKKSRDILNYVTVRSISGLFCATFTTFAGNDPFSSGFQLRSRKNVELSSIGCLTSQLTIFQSYK